MPPPIRIPRPGRPEIKRPEPINSTEAMKKMFASGIQVYKEETPS